MLCFFVSGGLGLVLLMKRRKLGERVRWYMQDDRCRRRRPWGVLLACALFMGVACWTQPAGCGLGGVVLGGLVWWVGVCLLGGG